MANLEIEIERAPSGVEWFRVVLYTTTDVGYKTVVLGSRSWRTTRAWLASSQENRIDTGID